MSDVDEGFDVLKEFVIDRGTCCGCGLCVTMCTKGLITFDGIPKLVGECTECGRCNWNCPRLPSAETGEVIPSVSKAENSTDDELIGPYTELLGGEAVKNEILERCQDGGVVTAILCACLERGYIDGAIVTGIDPGHPWKAKPMVATTADEIIAAAGTKYLYPAELSMIKKAIKESKLEKIAVVTRPCGAQAVRKMQNSDKKAIKRMGEKVKLLLGLFCMESFSDDFLQKEAAEKRGIALEDIKKVNIKKDFIITPKSGENVVIPMDEASSYIRDGCHFCADFASEYADVSCGAVGTKGGSSTIVVRNNTGKEAVELATSNGWLSIRTISEKALKVPQVLSKRKKEHAKPIPSR